MKQFINDCIGVNCHRSGFFPPLLIIQWFYLKKKQRDILETYYRGKLLYVAHHKHKKKGNH